MDGLDISQKASVAMLHRKYWEIHKNSDFIPANAERRSFVNFRL